MLIRANEIQKYMTIHGVEQIPLEAVEMNIPKLGYQKAKGLPTNCLVVFRARISRPYGSEVATVHLEYSDANHKRGKINVPETFEFNVVTGDAGQKMLNDLAGYEGGLEAKFRQTVDKYNPEIQTKLAAAVELIEQAENIANEHGIPFRPNMSITGFSMSYIPENFNALFGSLDSDLVYDATNASGQDYAGWQTSQTC